MTLGSGRGVRAGPIGLARNVIKVWALMGGVSLVAVVAINVISVVGAVVWKPFPGDFEMTEVGVAVAAFAFLPYCQLTGANVTADIFTAGASPRWIAAFTLLGSIIALGFSLVLLRQGDLAHGRGGRQRRAADRAEDRAGGDGGHRRAAAQPAEPGVGGPEHVLAEAGPGGERAHQHEHRDDRQVVDRELVVGQSLQLAQEDLVPVQQSDADAADQDHRVGDRYADRDQQDQHDQAGDAARQGVEHRFRPSSWSERSRPA
jgi:hypothetical protein